MLQEKTIERLGGNESTRIDCRFIAAAKADLQALSERGEFRDDLYYRLHVACIELPPLRERREDIPLLLAHCLRLSAERYNTVAPTPPEQLARWMAQPGRAMYANSKTWQTASAWAWNPMRAPGLTTPAEEPSLAQQMDGLEKQLLGQALAACQGNVGHAAERLKLPRKTLYDKMACHQLDPAQFR